MLLKQHPNVDRNVSDKVKWYQYKCQCQCQFQSQCQCVISMITSLQCHSYLIQVTLRQCMTTWLKELFFFKDSQRRKLRFIQRGERTDQDVRAPHGTACGGLGWVRNCFPLCWLQVPPTNQPTNQPPIQIHINHSAGWERWCRLRRRRGPGRLLKQGQAVAISGWYSSCWTVIHTHSNPARLKIECRGCITSYHWVPALHNI